MNKSELLDQLKQLNNSDRLVLIEAATRLVREDLATQASNPDEEKERRLQNAAIALKELYEPGGQLTEWTELDSEGFFDDSGQR